MERPRCGPSVFWPYSDALTPAHNLRSFRQAGGSEKRSSRARTVQNRGPRRSSNTPSASHTDWIEKRPQDSLGQCQHGVHFDTASTTVPQSSLFPGSLRQPILPTPAARLAMAINRRRNKSFGPGGSTRRLHRSPCAVAGFGGGEIGSTGDPKDDLLPGMIPPLSGQTYSCQRQLCSGGPRRVMR